MALSPYPVLLAIAGWPLSSGLGASGWSSGFGHDRLTGATERVSVDSAGAEANDLSTVGDISADGRFVAFVSKASNLVPEDTNNNDDIFVHDRLTGITSRVSVDSAGAQGLGGSHEPRISGDGRYGARRGRRLVLTRCGNPVFSEKPGF